MLHSRLHCCTALSLVAALGCRPESGTPIGDRERGVLECLREGPGTRLMLAAVTTTRDSAALVARGRDLAARYAEASGVDIVFFSDSARATCTFPMSDSALAASIGGYTLNRNNGYEALTFKDAP